MEYQYLNIAIEKIADTRTYDLHPYIRNAPLPPDLSVSIINCGLFTPPVVVKRDQENTYDIICGRKRLRILAEQTDETTCLCKVVPSAASAEEKLSILLEDQYISKGLSLIEQASFVELCHELIPDDDRRNLFLDTLEEGRITKGSKFLSQFTRLSSSVKRRLYLGVLSEKAVTDLQRFNDEDQSLLLSLIEKLQLSLNKQKKLLTEIHDACRRAEISAQTFLSDQKIREIVDHNEMNTPQKSSRLLAHLHCINYPLLSAAQSQFEEEVQLLQMPKSCSLEPPQAFEKDEVALTVRFRNIESFKRCWSDIKKHITE